MNAFGIYNLSYRIELLFVSRLPISRLIITQNDTRIMSLTH